ncbi:MAG: repeat-containing protein [Gammaproteobacteria bacterium]|nr:repeat-containing protein [Gammaproteobacteria bacterium]
MLNPALSQPAEQWMRHMRRGDWEAAWQISDKLLELRHGQNCRWLPRHLQTVWDGRPLAGQRVLVRCYHGLGDTLQFIRFAAPLRQVATHVTVLTQPQLVPLLRTVRGIDSIVPLHDGIHRTEPDDVDIEVMELPHALRTTLDTLPAVVPYIHLEKQPTQPRSNRGLCVGLVWQAGGWNARRSVAPELMQTVTGLDGICWKILQRGPALAAWPRHLGECPPISHVLDEAAELRKLDLLISVDTMSAHLGGALGVRTWTLLPAEADWRWMEEREDTPWYPTMRLFRQPRPGEWPPVIARVDAELRELRNRHAAHPSRSSWQHSDNGETSWRPSAKMS